MRLHTSAPPRPDALLKGGSGPPSGSDDRANTFDRGALRIGEQVGVSSSRDRIAVAKQRADQRQAGTTTDQLAGEAVAQVVRVVGP